MTAIGSTPSAFSQSAVSQAALRADLTRYEKQRSECVNCASAKTPEGQRNIQDLDGQISSLKARLRTVPAATSAASPAESRSSTASSAIGGRVDVYA